jgi:hypothetical protein
MFLNSGKLERATAIVKNSRKFEAGSVELTSLGLCRAEGVTGEAKLIECVYVKMGGALDAERPVLPTGEIEVKKIGKEKESLPSKRGK